MIMEFAFSFVSRCISSVFLIFDTLAVAFNAWPVIFGGVLAMLVMRFLIYPFLKIGIVHSDSVVSVRRSIFNSRSRGRGEEQRE